MKESQGSGENSKEEVSKKGRKTHEEGEGPKAIDAPGLKDVKRMAEGRAHITKDDAGNIFVSGRESQGGGKICSSRPYIAGPL